jgi:transposase-like protein
MYSYEEKIKAVKLLIKYDRCYAQVMREFGYPDRKSLMAWYKQYLSNVDLIKECERKAVSVNLNLGQISIENWSTLKYNTL